MHKNPTKARFIIAAPRCSLKPLSKALAAVFKLIYQQVESYNEQCCFFSGVKTFWPILNNVPVLNSIKNLNQRCKASSITCFDFLTLYTKIPHEQLLKVLNDMIDFCFKGGNHQFISVTKFGAKWVGQNRPGATIFTKSSLKNATKYLIENCFFKLGSKIFKQIIGIPMGSDPAPFFANLFLYHYEDKWIRKLKKSDLIRARKFANTFRFIDDLTTLNDWGEFEQHFREIYPPELELKKENLGNTEGSF